MRLDHIAYRTADRLKTADFFQKAFGYRVQTEFNLDFGDGKEVKCIALEPPEKTVYSLWKTEGPLRGDLALQQIAYLPEYHTPPEIFVSDGGPDTIVGQWVAARGGIGGIHHLAYQVESVHEKMKEWRDAGYAEFTSNEPFVCPGLVQVFTKPSELTGVIFEFIEREEFGFCAGNVKNLMLSTANADIKMR